MHSLLQELMLLPEMQYIKTELDGGVSTAVTGLSPIHRVQLSAALAQAMGRPLLLLCADERECERFAADMESLTGSKPLHLPGREMHLRPAAVAALAARDADKAVDYLTLQPLYLRAPQAERERAAREAKQHG